MTLDKNKFHTLLDKVISSPSIPQKRKAKSGGYSGKRISLDFIYIYVSLTLKFINNLKGSYIPGLKA